MSGDRRRTPWCRHATCRTVNHRNSARLLAAALAAAAVVASAPKLAQADEGGVGMWVPGFFGSLAATPLQPGWSLATIYYHSSVDASAAVARSRLITIGQFNPIIDISLQARLAARPDLLLFAPSYTFATPVLGGQANIALLQGVGHIAPSIDALLTASIGPFSISRFLHVDDERSGFSDLAAQGSLRWNFGVHNFMTYAAVSMPTGTYDSTRLANFGLGHWAIDGGGGYTYFNPETGNEFSAVLGFTYNFENPSTDYRNGIDMHLDLGASKFLTKQWQVGLVGYAYRQITCDSGAGNRVGCFESRVFGLGPQIGYVFPLGQHYQGYFNLKGYKEFEAENRAEGWNVWLTFAISPAAHAPPPPTTRLVRK
jgi:hypothetical protein